MVLDIELLFGVSEVADCVVVVVSEETGSISIAYDGKIVRGLTPEQLENELNNRLNKPKVKGKIYFPSPKKNK